VTRPKPGDWVVVTKRDVGFGRTAIPHPVRLLACTLGTELAGTTLNWLVTYPGSRLVAVPRSHVTVDLGVPPGTPYEWVADVRSATSEEMAAHQLDQAGGL
jgi:hypothetical protein